MRLGRVRAVIVIGSNMKGTAKGKTDKLIMLRSQMKDMSQNYQDMIKAREQAKKLLEARFLAVYEQIEENKKFTINECSRIIAQLNAFQQTFENKLQTTKKDIKAEIQEEAKFVDNRVEEINKKIDGLDRALEEEKQERIKQEEENLEPIRKDIEGNIIAKR
eukprot:TRINITY_DN3246_c0_g1_i3.p1 TRINITY_DN3246_c0_g1~~TRINITY_DN3246_c0_g1_i3.p1  ORF type:complete len:171 (-),score=65.08 TRINITY_DN3246_c0_g1_i3:405-890(-)